MSDIITTLHPENDANANLYPNIKKENIPDGAVDQSKLSDDVKALLNLSHEVNPAGVDTTTNILAKTSNTGIWVSSTNGHWFYWNGTAYVDSDMSYLSNGNVVSHNGNQLLDENNNNLYPNIDPSISNNINNDIEKFTGNRKIYDFSNKWIATNVGIGNIVDINTLNGDSSWKHAIVECNAGDEFLITGSGGTTPRVACFTDSTYHALFISFGDFTKSIIKAPTNSKYLIFNSRTSVDYEIIKEQPLVEKTNNVIQDFNESQLLLDGGFRLLKEAQWFRGKVVNGVNNTDIIYEISTANILHYNKDITLKIASGYEININYFDSTGTFVSQQSDTSTGEITLDHTKYFKISLRKILYNTNEQANIDSYSRQIAISTMTTIEKWKSKYRYLVTSFYGTVNNGLIFLGTNDLRTFDLLSKRGLYTATNMRSSGVSPSLRDPAIIQIGEWYYMTYTVAGFTYGDTDIGICRTKDFIHWEELANLQIPAPTGYDFDVTWAPCWFRNGSQLFIVATNHITNSRFCTTVSKYNVSSHTLSETAVIMDNTGIDYHIYKENGKYYACGSGGKVYRANDVYGTYTLITSVDSVTSEADFIVQLDNGKWRRYKQELSAYNEGRQLMIYQDADTLESEWGEEHYCIFTNEAKNYITELGGNINMALYYHWTVFDWYNSNNNNNNFTS